MTKILILALSIALLAGCDANSRTAFRLYSQLALSESKVVGANSANMDAKTRAIVAVPLPQPNNNAPQIKAGGIASGGGGSATLARYGIVCAEPSPDALSAVSSAFAMRFGGLFGGSDVETELSTAISEAASQLGVRGHTVQLMRDGYYRLCETHMNGLIDRETWSRLMGDYIDQIAVLLMIEHIAPIDTKTVTVKAPGNVTVNLTPRQTPKPSSNGGSAQLPNDPTSYLAAGPRREAAATIRPPEDLRNGAEGLGKSSPLLTPAVYIPGIGTPKSDADARLWLAEEEKDTQKDALESKREETNTLTQDRLVEDSSEQRSSVSSEAPAPSVSVTVPSGRQQTSPEAIRAITLIAQGFLDRKIVSSCARFIDAYAKNPSAFDKGAPSSLLTVCGEIFKVRNTTINDAIKEFTTPKLNLDEGNEGENLEE